MFVVESHGLRLAVQSVDLACCAVEVASAVRSLEPLPAPDVAHPADAHVLLVAGTVTRAGAPTVVARWQELPEPRYLVAYGACATTGGPYWDSYAVVPGVGELLPVDVVVPGCPPPPETVLAALDTLAAGLAAAAEGGPA